MIVMAYAPSSKQEVYKGMLLPMGEIKEVTAEIAKVLGEDQPGPVVTIERLVFRIGKERAQSLLQEAIRIETEGGMVLPDGSRKRSLGGIFFKLAKDQTNLAERRYIWPYIGKPREEGKPVEQPPEMFYWDERENYFKELVGEVGEATNVKITLIGRPGRVMQRGDVVLMTMQNQRIPTLPRGLPTPPNNPTTYVVYIARRQWVKVAPSLEDPQDILIIEGYPTMDDKLKAVAVYATNVTTKLLQAAKRQSDNAPA